MGYEAELRTREKVTLLSSGPLDLDFIRSKKINKETIYVINEIS